MIHETALQQIDPTEPIDPGQSTGPGEPIDLGEPPGHAGESDTETPRERLSALARILRGLGAAVLVAAASVFLLQRWTSGDDLLRYAALIGLTGVFGAAGIACGLVLKESKAARTLLALVMGLVPVHAAVLGGFIYSRFGPAAIPGHLPAFGVWIAGSDSMALMVTGGALLALLPLVYLGARALTRPHAVMVTLVTFAINLPLLLPYRGAATTGFIVAALTALWMTLEMRWVHHQPAMRTVEGRVVRLLWMAPLVIAVVRTFLYDPTTLFYGILLMTLSGALFAAGRLLPQHWKRSQVVEDPNPFLAGLSSDSLRSESLVPETLGPARLLEAISLGPGVLGWICVVSAMDIPIQNVILMVSLPLAAMMVALSLYSVGNGSGLRWLAAAVAVTGISGNLLFHPTVTASFLCLMVAIATVAYSFFAERKLLLVGGLAAAAFGLVYQVRFALDFYSWSRWGGLAAIGLATILAAALLERHQTTVVAWTQRQTHRMKSWSL